MEYSGRSRGPYNSVLAAPTAAMGSQRSMARSEKSLQETESLHPAATSEGWTFEPHPNPKGSY